MSIGKPPTGLTYPARAGLGDWLGPPPRATGGASAGAYRRPVVLGISASYSTCSGD
jgi:hypothetical protein